MEKVLNITDRLEIQKRKREVRRYREKLMAIQRAVQCATCQFKCSMCGRQFREDERAHLLVSGDYNLCKSCGSEFDDFIKITTKQDTERMFWHQEAWLRLWSAWVDYQEALKKFRESQEFKQLLEYKDI